MMRRALFAAALFAGVSGTASATLFKWVDADGKVQYSDKPPVVTPQQGVTELNRQGRVTRPAESAAQRQAREAREAAERQAAQRAREAQRYDRALLESYRSVADIERERDRRLAEVQSALNTLTVERQAQAARLAAATPAERQSLRGELAATDAQIAQRRQEAAQIRARAAADIERFKVLKKPATAP